MIVRRIEAEGWGCFANAIEIGPLSDGVNVLYGPNGTGKSTLLETIIRGLLDSHAVGGNEAQALRPWGRSLTPKVRIEFTHGGVEYRLRKRFLDKPSALLEVREDGGWKRFAEDEAADRHVRGLFRAEAPGSGLSSSKHWGSTQVLWSPQEPQELQPLSGDVLADIRASLGFQIAGPDALRMQRRIEAVYAELYTPTGRLRSGAGEAPVSGLRRSKADAEVVVGRARQELQKLETSRSRVAQLQSRYAGCVDSSSRLNTSLKEARTLLIEYEGIVGKRAERQQRKRAAQAEYFKAKQHLDAIKECVAAVALAGQDLKAIAAELPNASERLAHTRAVHQSAIENLNKALSEQEKAVRASQEAALARQLMRYLETQANLRARIEGAAAAQIEVERCRGAILGLGAPSQTQLAQIREAMRGRDEARLKLESSLIALEIHPIANTTVQVLSGDQAGEHAVLAGQSTRISGSPAVEIEIPGFGRIRATGPKASTAEYKRQLDVATTKVQALVKPYSTDELPRLEEMGAEAISLGNALQSAEIRFETYTQDQSIDELRFQQEQTDAEIEKILREQPSWSGELPDVVGVEGLARKTHHEAEFGLRAAQQASTEAQEALNEARLSQSGLQTRRDHREEDLRNLNQRLEQLRSDGKTDEARQEELRASALEYDAQESAVLEFDKALAVFTTGPSVIVKRLEPQVEQAERQRDLLREQLRDEEAGVRQLSSSAPYSILSEAEEKLASIERELRDEEVRTEAVKLLGETIEACRSAAIASIPEQVAESAAAILQRIAGTGFQTVRLSTGLLPVGVSPTSVDTAVALSDLSGGEKEQVDFSVRLALAKQLARSEPQLLVLDDSMTKTDPARFERILRLLEESTDQLQVLILTCNPERYKSLGAAKLHDLKRAAEVYKAKAAA
jgi:DNA repair exonuclease SbcCD ATPase subunit